MKQIEDLKIKDFDYYLTDEKIAKFPLEKRDESKLLVFKNSLIEESFYKNLPRYLPENSFLVFNNTKVVEVRLLFPKETGSIIEIFCLEPDDDYKDITSAMMQKGTVKWKCLVGGVKKWKNEILKSQQDFTEKKVELTSKRLDRNGDAFIIQFDWNDDSLSFAEILHLFGNIPLPPYLRRIAEEEDKERYQTVYARWDGSVAAPTAGLHFTNSLLKELEQKGIEKDFVTLHVGAGTFKPVKTETVAEHEMHAEFIEVSYVFIENLIHQLHKKVVAVGTTSLRTLESLYWFGVKTFLNSSIQEEDLEIKQWEVYSLPQDVKVFTALESLLQWMKSKNLQRLITKTQIIIVPGYRLRTIDGIITNFHQPQSTLLLLIAAVIGEEWKRIYDYALAHNFRFLSYGDGSLLWKKDVVE